MKTSKILSDARGRLDRGWCQRVGADEHGNLCAVAAVGVAESAAIGLGVSPTIPYPVDALYEKLKEFGSYQTLVEFNDDPHTSKQDVLNLFDKTILGLQEKGL